MAEIEPQLLCFAKVIYVHFLSFKEDDLLCQKQSLLALFYSGSCKLSCI